MKKILLLVMAIVFTMPIFTGQSAEAAAKGRILLVASSQQTMTLKDGSQMDVGFYLSELAVPAQYLAQQGYEVVLVSEDHDFLLRCKPYDIHWMNAKSFLSASKNRKSGVN